MHKYAIFNENEYLCQKKIFSEAKLYPFFGWPDCGRVELELDRHEGENRGGTEKETE